MAAYQTMTRQEKLAYLRVATDNALGKVTENAASWREFLRFYANIYKYQFSEALQIYEQNPNVTMCGEIRRWNAIGRRVNRGTYGIPILSETDRNMDIRYVFDVKDTYGSDIPETATLPDKYKGAVFAEISNRFRTVTPNEIQNIYDKKFKNAIEEYARETCLNYIEGLQYEVKGSFLEELDMDNLRKHFTDTVVDSVGYMVCEKLGIEKGIYNDDTQAFQCLFAFNTKAVISHIGIALNYISRNVINLVNETIQKEKQKERISENERIYDERNTSGVVADDADGGGSRENGEKSADTAADGQIRESVLGLSGGAVSEPGDILADGGETAGLVHTGEPGSQGDDVDVADAVEAEKSDTDDEYDVGTVQHMGTRRGRGNRPDRDSVQIQVESEQSDEAESESPPLFVGLEMKIGNRIYSVDSIDNESGTVSLLDNTFRNSRGFPIFRTEKINFILNYLSDYQKNNIPEYIEAADDIRKPDLLDIVSYALERPEIWKEYPLGKPLPPQDIDGQIKFDIDDFTQETKRISTITPIEKPPIIQPENKISTPVVKPDNFRITDENFAVGGAKTKYRRNIEAIQTLKHIENENKYATFDEQEILSRYVGWGGMPQAFDGNNDDWVREYAELRGLLNDNEYNLARGSTLNAHYTSVEVINGIYTALDRMGFKGGNILEPAMGVGNFYGLLPENLEKSRLYGVELDSITGRIAQQLYPQANIQVTGFEKADLQDNFFDCAVSNVPFGSYKVSDTKFDKYNFLIHDYFFCKTLDKIRPGGVIAFITSKGTLDKANTSVRRYLAERAELLGTVRLPNTAFKSNAGTEVTTDIIFLRKRDKIIEPENEKWIYTGKTADDIPLNEYYIENPHMMLGKMAFDNSMYGGNNETTLNPDNRALGEALHEAVSFFPENIIDNSTNFAEIEEDTNIIYADPTVKNFCYAIIGNEIYQRINSHMEKCTFPQATLDRVKSMIDLRNSTRNILTAQLDGISDEGLQNLQSELNIKYYTFVKKYGIINSKYNANLFGDDADFPLLSALEETDDEGKVAKTAIFSKRTIAKYNKIDHVDSSFEALPVCLNERGYVDIPFMAGLTGKSPDDIITDLRGIIFKNPAYNILSDDNDLYSGWETADEYLSGRVRDKLLAAEVAVKDNPFYAVNVEALRAVQPTPLEAHEISARIGAHWVDPSYYRQFLIEKFNLTDFEQDKLKVTYTAKNGEWEVERPPTYRNSITITTTYGTSRMDAYELFAATLNQRNAKVYMKIRDKDGKERTIINQKETIAVREKQSLLKQEFKRWIFDDPDRRERLVSVYNNLFNSERPRIYDGSHLTFPGMSRDIVLRDHQKNAVARIVYGGNTLLAHVVGAGKTYTMAAAAMELKRLGIAKKSCFVVPNHLVQQWANEFKRLYPTANILAATKKDFQKENRKKFCARIATGEWDGVIIGHSSFERIPISRERQENRLKHDIKEIENSIIEAGKATGYNMSVKLLQKVLKNVQTDLENLQKSPKDDLVTFEELGIDNLFVDEAHGFKNKFIFTKMNNVAGLSKARAKKSTDMDLKCEYINEFNNAERGVVFATGTPVSNSMVEMYTMQSYLQRKELERLGLHHFDNWAADFGEVISSLELAPSGQGYKVRERFAKFVGLPELMGLFGKVADIQTADMLNLPVPEIVSGKPITIAVEPSPELKEYVDTLVERSEKIQKRLVDPMTDNMLCVTNDGRNAALDMRIIAPDMPDYPDSKVNVCIKKVMEIYAETAAQKSTQLIFSDLSTPKKDGSFSVYDDVREKLLNMGVNSDEIAFIHEADTDEKKEKLFSKVRRGEVRILLGSTQKMGSGTNCQTRLIALHHLDCPYRPSDLEQRNGRIVRQGNTNPTVQIYQYVVKQSFDAYLWQIIESKQKFIGQIMSGKSPSREMEDIDETVLNYAEVKAIASGNPQIKRKMELDLRKQQLEILEAQYEANKYKLQNFVRSYPKENANYDDTIKRYEADIIMRDSNSPKDFQMKIGEKIYDERKEAGELLLKIINSNQYNGKVVGIYRGFEIIPEEAEYIGEIPKVLLRGSLSYGVELSTDNVGSIMRIEHGVNGLNKALENKNREYENLQRQYEAAKVELTRPFEQESELSAVLSELEEVNASLDIGRNDDIIVIDDEDESDGKTEESEDFKKPVFVREEAEEDYGDELEVG